MAVMEQGNNNTGLSFWTILAYAGPMLGMSIMFNGMGMYYMKYVTDVLLIAPATIGILFGLSRIWDAISDPLCGYLSDITRSRFGRRRIWILFGVPLMCIFFVMLWLMPESLAGMERIAWVAIAMFGFFTATTVFHIPHYALGGELSTNYAEKSRIYGTRMWMIFVGVLLASFGFVQMVINSGNARSMLWQTTLAACAVIIILVMILLVKVRENPSFQGRGGTNIFKSIADVWKNKHARLVYISYFIDMAGNAALLVILFYFSQYILGDIRKAPMFMGIFSITGVIAMPLWVLLSNRFSKKASWMFSMVISIIGYSLLFLAGKGDIIYVAVVMAILGFAGCCGHGIGPAICSDCIDYDEYITGERKEGAYFAFWHFVYKLPMGVLTAVLGIMLQSVGFVPGAEQTAEVKLFLRIMISIVPTILFIISIILFSRFSLNKKEHTKIRAEIDTKTSAK